MAKKLTYKIFSYLVILFIFFFLGKALLENWQKVKNYHFSFNYFCLILSWFFMSLAMVLGFCIWNKMLRILEPEKKISYLKAIQIAIYTWFGRYLPGKVWMFAGRVYLGRREGLSKKVLTVSAVYEIVLSIASGFLLSFLLLSIAFGHKLQYLYLVPALIIIGGLFFIHPKIICPLFNIGLRKFRKTEIQPADFLSYRRIAQIIFFHSICFLIEGTGFFFLVNAIAPLSFCAMIGVIGAYVLSVVSGAVALFAPAGLGVREGILVLILQFYLPVSIAVLISLMARIWISLIEIVLFSVVYLISKIRKI